MLSYWEQQSFLRYHHIVAGAGIVGLSVAIELKKRYPGQTVLVLERGLFPTGASTRNAGFACMGSATELLADLKTMSESAVLQLFGDRKRGLEILRGRLGDNAIGYREQGSYELICEKELYALDQIGYLNELLTPVTGRKAFGLVNDDFSTFGFSKTHVRALIQNHCEGEIETGKMMRALTDLAISSGVEIKTGAEISRFEEESTEVAVFITCQGNDTQYKLGCRTFSICTNAFTRQLLPDEDVVPGRGQVLITEPLSLPFKGIYHFDEGYYYFRAIDGRILIGGGRNLDFETERTTEIMLNEHIQQDLEEKLKNMIVPGREFKVALRWAGIMAFGANKQPIVKAFSNRVFGAFRMGGMGVALGSLAASRLGAIIEATVDNS